MTISLLDWNSQKNIITYFFVINETFRKGGIPLPKFYVGGNGLIRTLELRASTLIDY
jgi:hypothetical protein